MGCVLPAASVPGMIALDVVVAFDPLASIQIALPIWCSPPVFVDTAAMHA